MDRAFELYDLGKESTLFLLLLASCNEHDDEYTNLYLFCFTLFLLIYLSYWPLLCIMHDILTVATKLASDDLVVQKQLAHIYNEMGAAYLKSASAHKAEEMFIKAIKLYHGLKMYTGR